MADSRLQDQTHQIWTRNQRVWISEDIEAQMHMPLMPRSDCVTISDCIYGNRYQQALEANMISLHHMGGCEQQSLTNDHAVVPWASQYRFPCKAVQRWFAQPQECSSHCSSSSSCQPCHLLHTVNSNEDWNWPISTTSVAVTLSPRLNVQSPTGGGSREPLIMRPCLDPGE